MTLIRWTGARFSAGDRHTSLPAGMDDAVAEEGKGERHGSENYKEVDILHSSGGHWALYHLTPTSITILR